MPHRQDVKGAAELQPLGLGSEPQPELNEVGKDLIALALKMMLRRPQHVETELIHEPGDVPRGEKGLPQPLIGITPIIGRRAGEPDIVEFDLSDIKDVKLLDHVFLPRRIPKRLCGGVNNIVKPGAERPPGRIWRSPDFNVQSCLNPLMALGRL